MPRLHAKFFFLGIVSFSQLAVMAEECQNYDVFVMRHFPKAESSDNKVHDPELSEIGREMANKLSQLEFMNKTDVAFSTSYQRTIQTITPSAERHDFQVLEYDPRDNDQLLQTINQQHCNQQIVIIGHSNTVPTIVNALGGTFEVSFSGQPIKGSTLIQLDENAYGTVFRVLKEQGTVKQSLFRIEP